MIPMSEWKSDILRCNKCGRDIIAKKEAFVCTECGKTFKAIDGILIVESPISKAIEFYEKGGGTTLLERSYYEFSTAYYETRAYYDCLEKSVSKLDRDCIIMDLGCGDGRAVKWLLSQGFYKIIAVDSNLEGLKRYKNSLNATDNEKIFFINTDIFNLPLIINCVDAILTIEVLCYLNEDYAKGCKVIHSLLKNGGIFVTSDPSLEGCLLYDLLLGNLSNFVGTVTDRRKREAVRGKDVLLSRVFKEGEIDEILNKTGFNLLNKYGISAFPSLTVRVLSDGKYSEKTKQDIKKVLIDLIAESQSPYRCICYVSRKISNVMRE